MPNRKPNPIQGPMSAVKRILAVIISLGLIVAFFQIPADPSVKTVYEGLESRAETIRAWAQQVGEWDFSLNTPETLQPKIDFNPQEFDFTAPEFNIETVKEVADALPTDFTPDAPYNRGDWYHWDNYERTCWNVREEVLYRDAEDDGSLTVLDADKIRTDDKNEACYVSGGTWIDPFTGEEFGNPQDLDIDHVIALSYANSAGGASWSSEKKRQFANSLTYDKHLLAVSASANRSKGDKGPGDWMPPNEDFHCEYVTIWTKIAAEWELSITPKDKRTIKATLEECEKNPIISLLDNM